MHSFHLRECKRQFILESRPKHTDLGNPNMEAVSCHFIVSKNKDIRELGCIKTHWGTLERQSQLGAVLGG